MSREKARGASSPRSDAAPGDVQANARSRPARRVLTISALIVLLGSLTAVPSLAGHETGSVASYTGCLKNGKIENLAVGDNPAGLCERNAQVHLSGGDITGVVTDPSLQGGWTEGTVELGINPAITQRRVFGRCDQVPGHDASIVVIDVSGQVSCNEDDVGETAAFAGSLDAAELEIAFHPGDGFRVVTTLSIPEGSYVINAKISFLSYLADCCTNDDALAAACTLFAGSDSDRSGGATVAGDGFTKRRPEFTIPLQLVHTTGAGQSAEIFLGCRVIFSSVQPPGSAAWVSGVKITALQVDGLSNVELQPGAPG
jgi:hypothetical protein